MEYELTWFTGTILVLAGVFAGFINTLAGGGSVLTLPALMLMGMPADVANGTNRVSVFLQSLVGARGFHKHQQLDQGSIIPSLIPTIVGSVIGAVVASYLPEYILKPVLLATMVAITLVIVFKPNSVIIGEHEQPFALNEKPMAYFWLFLAGVYGGFIHAGVGIVLIAIFSGVLRYTIVQANALKLVLTMVSGVFALGVFVVREQVLWVPGLILGVGTIIGVHFTVQFSINASQKTLKSILLVLVVFATLAALFKS